MKQQFRGWINLKYVGIFTGMKETLIAVESWLASHHDFESEKLAEIQIESVL